MDSIRRVPSNPNDSVRRVNRTYRPSTHKEDEESEQDETQQPSPAALFAGVCVGLDAGLGSTLAPAGDGACSGRSQRKRKSA
jgi:hypothetical protein